MSGGRNHRLEPGQTERDATAALQRPPRDPPFSERVRRSFLSRPGPSDPESRAGPAGTKSRLGFQAGVDGSPQQSNRPSTTGIPRSRILTKSIPENPLGLRGVAQHSQVQCATIDSLAHETVSCQVA